jgi:type II secretory pathway pseudopilin PulG
MIKTASQKSKKYSAYSLLEMLLVLAMLGIFGGMAFGTFNGLQNTVKMNEYMLSLEQDIRTTQRMAMLLERGSGERWLYGIGIDFSSTQEDGKYRKFKWCSQFNDYGAVETKSDFPNYDPALGLGGNNGRLPIEFDSNNPNCDTILGIEGSSKRVPVAGESDSTVSVPKSEITLSDNMRYVLFESVSGKAFFYNVDGSLANYDGSGNPVNSPTHFSLTINPQGAGKTQTLFVDNLSGRIRIVIEE